MNIEDFRDYCLSKKAVHESMPFDAHTLVFKVGPKMFALARLDQIPLSINLKCDPDRALRLREAFPEIVLPGYHSNKKHWNTLIIDGSRSNDWYCELIDHSYKLVLNNMTRKQRLAFDLT